MLVPGNKKLKIFIIAMLVPGSKKLKIFIYRYVSTWK
jgi:hypothetical protein